MSRITLGEIVAQQQAQQEALLELIDIALGAIKESGDSSVASIHLITRLNKLAGLLRQSGEGIADMQREGPSVLHH